VRLGSIEDLMRHLGAAGRTGDEVTAANRIFFLSNANFSLAFQDEEHFLVHGMIVERESSLPRRHQGDVVTELLRAHLGTDPGETRAETIFQLGRNRYPEGFEFQVVDIKDSRG